LIISVSITSGCKTVPKNEGREAKKIIYKDLDEKLPEYPLDQTPYSKDDAAAEGCSIDRKDKETD